MKKIILSSLSLAGLVPMLASAQVLSCSQVAGGNLEFILCQVSRFINAIIPILIALAVLYFIWGVIQYVVNGDEEAKTAGRDKMIYGIIGLLVIVSIWGLVSILQNTFGVSATVPGVMNVPCIPTPGSVSGSNPC